MSDDIIKRLRFVKHTADWEACDEAAARLDKVERENEQLRATAVKARASIQAMMAEFRALDLPYGSTAYNQASDTDLELRKVLGDLI